MLRSYNVSTHPVTALLLRRAAAASLKLQPLLIMKFLGIRALKVELSERSLGQLDVFRYWLASTILLQLALFPVSNQPSGWDYVIWLISLVVAVVMIWKCYLSNGGSSGQNFSDKLISIGWVMALRGFLIVFLPLGLVGSFVAGLYGELAGLSDEGIELLATNYMLFAVLIYELWVWLRTASHIRDVR